MTSSAEFNFLVFTFTCLLLILFANAFGPMPMAAGFAGVLNIQLDYYRQTDPARCDRPLLFVGMDDPCDPYFIVSAGPPGRRPLASFESEPIDNAHKTLQFGRKIGQLSNPLQFSFRVSDGLKDLLEIEVKVKDHDPMTPDDLMEQFRWALSLANLTTGVLDGSGVFVSSINATLAPTSALLIGERGSGDQLSLQAWVSCRPGRAGPACLVACTPGRPARGGGVGGFGCELATGHRVCLPGFVDPDDGCWRRDPCAVDPEADAGLPCAHGGECRAGSDGRPVCRCLEGFAGPRCQTVVRPCGGGSRACVHGVCLAAAGKSGGAGRCVCDPGYQGDLCDQDIDECRLLSLCQHNSICVNTPGSFECRCQPGYSGRLCQLPPMLLPPPEAKPVAATAQDSSSPTRLTAVLLSVIAFLMLALLLLLLLLLLRWRRHGNKTDSAQFAAIFTRRPAAANKPDSDGGSCYDSIDEFQRLRSAGENPYEPDSGADGENFPNAAYALEAVPLSSPPCPPSPPPPRLSAAAPPAYSRRDSPTTDNSEMTSCYV